MKYKYEIVQVSDEEWEERKLGSAYILDGGVKGVVIDGLGHEEPDGTEVGLLVIRVEEKEEYRELSAEEDARVHVEEKEDKLTSIKVYGDQSDEEDARIHD